MSARATTVTIVAEIPPIPDWALFTIQRRTLHSSYCTAQRFAPNGFEKYYQATDVKASSDLVPEKIRTFELAVEHNITKNLRGIVSAYHYQLDQLITQVADPADGFNVFRNIPAE